MFWPSRGQTELSNKLAHSSVAGSTQRLHFVLTNSFWTSFIDNKLIHNFLYKLHKIKFLYMFRASSAHLQEVNDVNCTCMQPAVCIHVQFISLTSWRWADDARNMQRNLILCNLYKKLCIKLLSIKELYYDARPTKSQNPSERLSTFQHGLYPLPLSVLCAGRTKWISTINVLFRSVGSAGLAWAARLTAVR